MHEDKKKTIVSMSATFVLVVILTIAAFSYAYFSANTNISNNLSFNVVISDDGSPLFTGYGDGNLTLTVTTADMLPVSAGTSNTTVGATTSQLYHTTLTGGKSSNPVNCTYSMFLKDVGTTYAPSSGVTTSMKEFTIKVRENGTTYVVPEMRIDKLSFNSSKVATLVEGLTISSSGSKTTKDYEVVLTIYNLNINQTIYNKNYKYQIGVNNVVC